MDSTHRFDKLLGGTGLRAPNVVVVGSVNMDLVVRVARLPRPGETLHGRSFDTVPGGKGANQAVAAARLGAAVRMVGRVGGDAFGGRLVESLRGYGVDTRHVRTTPDCSSGVATIGVEESGENAIVVIAGANGCVTPDDVARAERVIAAADTVLLQLEIPAATVAAAVATARRYGVRVILNPAPASAALPAALFRVDAICPNESEARALTGIGGKGIRAALAQARWLIGHGAGLAVVTLGARGAAWCERGGEPIHMPPFRVKAVDTTAAGDAFAGALAVALSEGRGAAEAVRFACAAGALAATKPGAQPAMPSRAEVDALAPMPKAATTNGRGYRRHKDNPSAAAATADRGRARGRLPPPGPTALTQVDRRKKGRS